MPTAVPNVVYKLVGDEWVSPGRLNLPPGQPPAVATPKLRVNGVRFVGPVVVAPTIPADWSESNLPWAYTSTSQFTATWPVGTPIVDLITGSGDFYTDCQNTIATAGKRVVIRLPDGDHRITLFRLIGTSGDPTFASGLWDSNRWIQGFLGNGPDKCFFTLAAGSVTTAQLNAMKTMTAASFNALQMNVVRFDGTNPSSPILIAGITFRSEDQQLLTAVASDLNGVYVPQPAPHQGMSLYYESYYDIGYCRFQAFGRAMTSAPPFEMANITSIQSTGVIHNCELDGRLAAEINPLRPRRSGPLMGNGEHGHQLVDCWVHDSNVSRYAMNDQGIGQTTPYGSYTATRVKLERITNQQNRDPAINGGNSLGGWTNASTFGWESNNGVITVNDSVISVDNPNVSGQFPAHFQLTSVGSRNPRGGRLHAKGNTYRNSAFPQLDGFCTLRIATITYWWQDGVATTLDIRRADDTPLIGYNFTGTWPPTAAQIAAAGISPSTHYIYKGV